MSTKTTFKRIALVAVAALGLGVLSSVAPANAAAGSFSLDTTSVTVVEPVLPAQLCSRLLSQMMLMELEQA